MTALAELAKFFQFFVELFQDFFTGLLKVFTGDTEDPTDE